MIPSFPVNCSLFADVQVEIYLDLSCADSAAAWPTIAEVVEEFGDDAEFIYRLFALPHHQIGFTLAQVSAKQFIL